MPQDDDNTGADSQGPFQQLVGYEITEWGPGTATLTLDLAEKHLNRNGVVHGGVLRVEARKTGGGRRLFFAEASAFDAEGNLLGTAVTTCRYASGQK